MAAISCPMDKSSNSQAQEGARDKITRGIILQDKTGTADPVPDLFCTGRANLGTVATVDTSFFYDVGLIVFDLNRFYRTFTDTFITVLTIFRFGIDRF